MFTTLLTKEIQETIQTYRFLIATLLCVVLVPLGMYVTMKNYEQRLSDYRDNDNIYHQRAEGRLYYSFQGEGYRPPSQLSVFSVGLEYYMPSKALTSREDRITLVNDQGIDNAQSLLFGKMCQLKTAPAAVIRSFRVSWPLLCVAKTCKPQWNGARRMEFSYRKHRVILQW